jgi:hypothetical protein
VSQANSIKRAWLVSWLIAMVCFAAGPVDRFGLWIVTGLIVFGWGLAWAANWRGAAEAMVSRAELVPYRRRVGGGFAVFGAGLVIFGIVALAR